MGDLTLWVLAHPGIVTPPFLFAPCQSAGTSFIPLGAERSTVRVKCRLIQLSELDRPAVFEPEIQSANHLATESLGHSIFTARADLYTHGILLSTGWAFFFRLCVRTEQYIVSRYTSFIQMPQKTS